MSLWVSLVQLFKANRGAGVLVCAGGNRLSHCHQQVLIRPADYVHLTDDEFIYCVMNFLLSNCAK